MSPQRGEVTQADIAALVREIDTLRRSMRDLQRTPQLHNSAVMDGALTAQITGYDELGDEIIRDTMYIGQQYDGTSVAVSVSGPTPPQATAPTAAGTYGGARVTWDGLFAEDPMMVAPMDFGRVEIHAHTDPAFTAEESTTIVGTFESPRGGDRHVPLPIHAQHTIKLVVRSVSGGRSPVSAGVDVTPLEPESTGEGIPTVPPAVSVPLTVTPYSIGFTLRADDIAATSTISYHVSTASGFTPDASTLLDTTRSQVIDTRKLPDGVTPYSLGTTYYFKTVVSNIVGPATGGAGPEAASALQEIGALDVADLSLTVRKFNTPKHEIY